MLFIYSYPFWPSYYKLQQFQTLQNINHGFSLDVACWSLALELHNEKIMVSFLDVVDEGPLCVEYVLPVQKYL